MSTPVPPNAPSPVRHRRRWQITALAAVVALGAATQASADPAGSVTMYNAPHTATGSRQGIAVGADNNLWFSNYMYGPLAAPDSTYVAYGKAAVGDGSITEYGGASHVLSGNSPNALSIVKGPGGLWLAKYGGVARITTATGDVQEVAITGAFSPSGIAVTGDNNLWVTDTGVSKITRLNDTGQLVSQYSLGNGNTSKGYGIVVGADDNLWFTEPFANKIGVMSQSGTLLHEYSTGISTGAWPAGITKGPDGNVWFSEPGVNKVAKITPDGVVTEYGNGISAGALDRGQDLGGAKGAPQEIAAGPDGNVWFAEYGTNSVGRITPAGVVTEYTNGFPVGILGPYSWARPAAITAGPDGNMWFTTGGMNTDAPVGKIGTGVDLTPATPAAEPIPAPLPTPPPAAAKPTSPLWLSSPRPLRTLGNQIIVTARSSEPGKATITGTMPVRGKKKNACRVEVEITRPGVIAAVCTLNAAARQARSYGRIRVTMSLRFAATNGLKGRHALGTEEFSRLRG